MRFAFARWRRKLRKRRGPVSTSQRIGWVRLGSVGLVLMLMGRLFQLQVVQNDFWEHQAELVRRRIEPIAAERGRILDREGRVLAGTRRSYDVVLDIKRLLNHCTPLLLAEALTPLRLAFVSVEDVLAEPDAMLDELLRTSPAAVDAIDDPGLRSETRAFLQTALERAVSDRRRFLEVLRDDDERSLAELVQPDRALLVESLESWRTRFTMLEEALDSEPGSLARCLDERRVQFLQWWAGKAERMSRTSMPAEDIARERVTWFRLRRGQATVFVSDCAYDPIVPLLAMDPDGFEGIRAEPKARRDYPLPIAPELIGMAFGPSQEQVEGFREHREEIDALRRKIHRTEVDQANLDELVETFRTEEYWPSDIVGHRGLEARYETELRGDRGYREAEWDRKAEDTTASPEYKAPVKGGDLVLTLDAALQREAERLLGQTSIEGAKTPVESYREAPRAALVLVEVATGDLLVLASYPHWTREEFQDDYEALSTRSDRPLHPAAFAPWRVPVPGSLLKPIYALEAFLDPAYSPNATVHCSGRWKSNGPHCHLRTGHGSVDLGEAIRKSCNVYFFDLAMAHGPYCLLGALERFGFGRRTCDDIPGELGGNVPGPPDRVRGGALLNIAIGQGEVETTPLQIAIAFAGVATGQVPQARLVRSANGVERPVTSRPLPYPTEAYHAVHAAMAAVCRTGGTASVLASLDIAGKSGTAQTGPGRPDHSWFAGFFPQAAPRYVICVFAEKCGLGGGKFAAPLARAFLTSDAAQVLWSEGQQR